MSDDEDSKPVCKYGAECYQKNPAHHAKFKHPKKRNRSPEIDPSKRPKVATSPVVAPKTLDDETDDDDDALFNMVLDVEKEVLELDDKKKVIKKFFLVDMPDDFYHFWEFCKELNKDDPKNALKHIGLTLVGPFDILTCDKVKNENGAHLLHWRYYYDPPEFQTIIKGDDKIGYHIGYFRDAPDESPSFVAENHANKDCIISPIGANIFGALNTYIDALLSKADPFKKMGILKIQKPIKEKAKELKIDIEKSTSSMDKRKRAKVCKGFHSAGIVVPYDRKTEVGYRPLSVNNKELIKICDKVSKSTDENRAAASSSLQSVITAATIAIDECDFGTGLELGINLFCYGNEKLDRYALRMLTTSYSVLNRDAFIEIAKAHLGNRKKGLPHVVDYS